MAAVNYFLDERHTGPAPDNKPWAEHGCIIFSQYFDTAKGVVAEIAKAHLDQVVAVYAGAGKVVFSEVKNFRRLNLATTSRDVMPRLEELAGGLLKYGAFGAADVDKHWLVFRKDPEALYALVTPVKELCVKHGAEWQRGLVSLLQEFRELYSFGVKIRPEAAKHQRLAVFAATLLRRLDKAEIQKSARLPLKVVMATVVPFTPEEQPELPPDTVRVPGPSPTQKPEAQALDHLLIDLSRKKLSHLADALHEVLEQMCIDSDVQSQALSNSFDVFSQQGVAPSKLSRLVVTRLMTGAPDGQALFEATQGDDTIAVETRLNILRVVYLRHQAQGALP